MDNYKGKKYIFAHSSGSWEVPESGASICLASGKGFLLLQLMVEKLKGMSTCKRNRVRGAASLYNYLLLQ
jgi:hypothetical protein